MKLPRRLCFFAFLCCLVLSTAAFADGSHERTQMGRNITIGPGEEVSEATCFGCSIRIRGHVAGDVTSFGGSIVIEDQGEVNGDATSFAGDIRLDKGVKVGGDITVFGGHLRRDPAASVGGDVTNMGGPGWIVVIFLVPLIFLGAFIAAIVWLIRRLLRPSVPATA
ncbi:MAG TPA: polymer-forming cytoskeletal protein [Candidatus Sulfotelmatobacter sp.]|nr:polymer-forming cytoskeletal protein [Candidatus Sulfotelmatobacter sp.]